MVKILKTIVWTENIFSAFGAKTQFSNLSGLVWTGPAFVMDSMKTSPQQAKRYQGRVN